MSPHWAVAWAAFFNFVEFLVFGFAVATTIGKASSIRPSSITTSFRRAVRAIAGISYLVLRIPSSSSHALVGGIIGAGCRESRGGQAGAERRPQDAVAIVAIAAVGFMLAITLMIAVSWIFARATPRRVDRWFRRLQFVLGRALTVSARGNGRARKPLGIIWMLLIASGLSAASEPLPFWW